MAAKKQLVDRETGEVSEQEKLEKAVVTTRKRLDTATAKLEQAKAEALIAWLQPYQELPYAVLATLSDGELAIIEALETCWPEAPRQRCQAHFLSNLADPALIYDDELRKWMKQDLGGLPKVDEDPLF